MLSSKENKDGKGEAKVGMLTKIIATALQTYTEIITYPLTDSQALSCIPISTIPIGEEIDLNAERLLLAYQIAI